MAGIHRDTPDPPGGKIGRCEESGEPNGYLEETAMFQALGMQIGRMGKYAAPDVSQAEQMYLEQGITTVQEGGATKQTMEGLLAYNTAGRLRVDVVAYPLAEEGALEIARTYAAFQKRYQGHVKLGGCKLILDGSPQGKSAWLTQPYENSGDYRGYPKYEDERVTEWIAGALRENLQVLAHCNGDAAGDQFLRCYEEACRLTGTQTGEDLRPVMIHCQTMRRDQAEIMRRFGMIASVFVGHVYFWGDIHWKNLGPVRGAHISPCRWALDQGVVVNLHQDMPVTRPNMLHSIWCAVNRVSRTGQIIGEDQKLTVYQAFRAASYGGAYAYYEEGEKGTLEAGKRADMIILDQDPFAIAPMEIRKIKVLETIKDGCAVYRRPQQ